MTVYLSLFAGAGAQFFDDNGSPLAGGFLFTYAAGTTTPATTYTDSTGNTANSNPIVLDAGGRVPYEIWLPAATDYKFILKDSNNVLIGTYDNIQGANNVTSILPVLAQSTGSTLIGTTIPGSSVTRTVAQKLADMVSVKDYGAVGDGVTNDAVAWNTAASQNVEGVFVPAGSYNLGSAVTGKFYSLGNVIITGAGGQPKYLTNLLAAQTNGYISKTSTYAIVNADKGRSLYLGGSAFYTVSLGAASGYDSDFSIKIYNTDTNRGKTISVNGYSSFILWPQQTVTIYNDNQIAWTITPRNQRWLVPSVPTLYVDPSLGNDANDGLALGAGNAMKTIAAAAQRYYTEFDLQNTYVPTIQLASPCTITEQLRVFGPLVGDLQYQIIGDPTTPSNCQWTVGSNQVCIQTRDLGIVTVNGFKFSSSGNGSIALFSSQLGVIDFINCDFGTFASGNHISVSTLASCNSLGAFTISGSTGVHVSVNIYGVYTQQGGVTISMPNTLTMGYFMQSIGGFINAGGAVTYSGAGAGTGTTTTSGTLSAVANGVISTGSNTFPGTAASGTSTGGQIV